MQRENMKSAYQYWRARGYRAIMATQAARYDVANRTPRYLERPSLTWQTEQRREAFVTGDPLAYGLREVGEVRADARGYSLWHDGRGENGWYGDPELQDRLISGHVFQIPAPRGYVSFVPATRDESGGYTVDFGRVVTERQNTERAQDSDAARSAAYAADDMARRAAEREAEYQTAWRAGAEYAEAGEKVADLRGRALALLAERRAARGAGDYPAICDAIWNRVSEICDRIATLRDRRAELRDGSADGAYWDTRDEDLRAAFAEGANN
jgi:hypothetical protein